jgi:hypothetical protein
MYFQEVGWGIDWIGLAQDTDRWWAVVNAVMNLRVPKMKGISGLDERRSASQSDGGFQR